jgi:ribonuclease HI
VNYFKGAQMTIDLSRTNGSSPPTSKPTVGPFRIQAWFDGACEPSNPGGHASWGAIVEVHSETVFEQHGYVGFGPTMSNNVAEYSGCIAALAEIANHQGDAIIFGDSKLVIEQLNGNWRTKKGLYFPYYERAKTLLEAIRRERIHFQWIPREENTRADVLSRRALLERGVQTTGRRNVADGKPVKNLSRVEVHKSRTCKQPRRKEAYAKKV